MLDCQQLLTAQVALDIGVHLELEVPSGTGWREGERRNAEIASEFLLAHSSWDERQLRSELRRCLCLPGQAPSYKLGERALSLGSMGLHPPARSARPHLRTPGKGRPGYAVTSGIELTCAQPLLGCR
jgi:hypothetical protein